MISMKEKAHMIYLGYYDHNEGKPGRNCPDVSYNVMAYNMGKYTLTMKEKNKKEKYRLYWEGFYAGVEDAFNNLIRKRNKTGDYNDNQCNGTTTRKSHI